MTIYFLLPFVSESLTFLCKSSSSIIIHSCHFWYSVAESSCIFSTAPHGGSRMQSKHHKFHSLRIWPLVCLSSEWGVFLLAGHAWNPSPRDHVASWSHLRCFVQVTMEHLLSSKLLLLGDRTSSNTRKLVVWSGFFVLLQLGWNCTTRGSTAPYSSCSCWQWVTLRSQLSGLRGLRERPATFTFCVLVDQLVSLQRCSSVCDVRGIKRTDVWSSLGWTLSASSAALWYGFTSLLFKYIITINPAIGNQFSECEHAGVSEVEVKTATLNTATVNMGLSTRLSVRIQFMTNVEKIFRRIWFIGAQCEARGDHQGTRPSLSVSAKEPSDG